MIDITTYIKELLFSHDCVILPSFGGFIGNYKPARIDSKTNTFSPPVKAISFNRNLNNNDGLLIAKISADRSVGYADSKRMVEQFVEDLKKRLAKGERVTLEQIGFFQNNNEGNVQFEPDLDSNWLLDSYGMTSFTREPVQDFSFSGKVISRRDREPSSGYISKKMVWRAVIAVPFIAAMIFVPLKTDLFREKVSLNPLTANELTENRNQIETASGEYIAEEPAVTTEVLEPTENDVVEVTSGQPAEEVIQEDENQGIIDQQKSFFIVAGSFKDQDNASNLKNDANEKGYLAEIIESGNGFYRVIVESATSYDEAAEKQDKLTSDFPETWIWKK